MTSWERFAERASPGVTLRQTASFEVIGLTKAAWSPDGRWLAFSSAGGVLRLWRDGQDSGVSRKFSGPISDFAWDPASERIAVQSSRETVSLWEPLRPEAEARSFAVPDNGSAECIEWSPNGRSLALAFPERDLVMILDTELGTRQVIDRLELTDRQGVRPSDLAWSPDGRVLFVAAGVLIRWDAKTRKRAFLPSSGDQHTVAFSPDGTVLATTGRTGAINIYAWPSGRSIAVVEGHTSPVTALAFSADNSLLASRSNDGFVRVWATATWSTVATVPVLERGLTYPILSFHPTLPGVLLSSGPRVSDIAIWDLSLPALLGGAAATEAVHYTTAKIVLVGDTGVGKTGLGWRLAHGEFKEHASTHGQQFWVLDELRTTRDDGTDCEAVLWDLAGQHVYRSVHAIFLDDVDAALLLFDATNRQDPLKGVRFWLEQLGGRKELPPTILIGARADRGAAVLARAEIEQFCRAYGIRGYLSVSALTDAGVAELIATLKREIRWNEMVTTVTTVTFKRIKEFVLALKESAERREVLVAPSDLRRRLEETDPDWQFGDDEMMGAVRHLQTHGYVAVLRGSSGEESILLAPDLLVGLASSIVLEADRHPQELGAVDESALLLGQYALAELNGLGELERQTLIEAAVLRFLEHNICFREILGSATLLLFPRLLKQKRPSAESAETEESVSYVVRGRVENVYAALVVLLGYTRLFTRADQWHHQAQFELRPGQIGGFRLVEEREGEIELVLYYSPSMPSYGRLAFQGLFEQFLHQRDVEVTAFPPVLCPAGHRQERATVMRRSREGKSFIFCDECGAKVDLADSGKRTGAQTELVQRQGDSAWLRSTYEAQLVQVKSYRRDRPAPRCFIVHDPDQTEWVAGLTRDLREAGIVVTGGDGDPADTRLVVHSSAGKPATPWPGRTLDLTRYAGIAPEAYSFGWDELYPWTLFDLVLRLHDIPGDSTTAAPLIAALTEQALAGVRVRSARAQIFISYAHRDEEFKDSLQTILAGLIRTGLADIWHDRHIEPGTEWHDAIATSIHQCDVAILLISPDFLASEFIQDAELPALLQQQIARGMTVIPIIVRPCPWQDEPVLAALQALPRDGEPVITFAPETGARDQVWTDIAREIRTRVIRGRIGRSGQFVSG